MSYCLNPTCPQPNNLNKSEHCQACGSPLVLRDRYRVIKALARGGFGSTFLAQDEGLPGHPSCVIKQLRILEMASEMLQMARELFDREAKTLGQIGNHPQIPRLLDYFEDNQQFYLVQEYVSGLTIQQEVKRSGPLSEAGVKQFLSELLPMVQYIHERQVIHRDIKPANLIRRAEDKRLVLIDFGAVKNQINQTSASPSEHTALTAFAVGTPGYAPPEQLAMRPVYASDIYALGVTCLYLLTGKPPKDLDYNPLTGEMLWERKVQTSEHFGEVLKKMLEGSVRHRYQSASEVLRALDLEPYLDGLVKGMTAQPSHNGRKQPPTQNKTDSASATTPTATLAEAIRSARRKSAETSNTAAQKTTASPGQQTKSLRKLDADSLLTTYLKGRRDFVFHDLSRLNLQQADLSGVNFRSSKLDRTSFQKAVLCNNDFSWASLKGTNLKEANLSKAYLHYADLEGAELQKADLSHAHLNNANLRGANLCGANLSGAKVTDEQLAQASTNWMTVLPNGRRQGLSWLKLSSEL